MNSSYADSSQQGMIGNVADFGNDLLSLAELQTRLVATEAQDAFARSRTALMLIAVALLLAAAALPVLMLGIAELIVEATGVSRGLGLVIVAAAVAGLGIVTIGLCLFWLKKMQLTMPHSREEAVRNWNWVRTVALSSGRGNQRR